MNYSVYQKRSPGTSLARRSVSRPRLHIKAVQTATSTTRDTAEVVLLKKFKAHESSLTALLVEEDCSNTKKFISTGLDKTLCSWTLDAVSGGELSPGATTLQCAKVEVTGGPVFSLQRGITPKIVDPNVKLSKPVIYLGLAAKEIAAWQPDQLTFNEKVRMNGHTGYVRSLATSGKYLFSCGCNFLRQWDQAYAVPKEVSTTKLFKGDILSIACGDKYVFTAGADGVLRSWSIGKTGELSEAAIREKAHEGRITCVVVHGSLLYSAGYDGAIKAWDMTTLQLVMEVKNAHDGERIQALVLGSNGVKSTSNSSNGSSPESRSLSPVAADHRLVAGDSGAADDCNTVNLESQICSDVDIGPADASAGPVSCESDAVSKPASVPSEASSSAATVLYSGGDDKLVRRWDAQLLTPIGDPLQVHNAAVKALAVGQQMLLVSGDAAGEVAVWAV